MPIRNSSLHGIGVLVTRPAHQAEPLCDRIAAAGGRPIRFPLLTICDRSKTAEVASRLKRLSDYHIAIFISPNAVTLGVRAINRHGGLPSGLKLACVGRGSARALKHILGRGPDIVPADRYDSEGLLALPALEAVAGQHLLIFRGEGGREQLAETLRRRGAKVDYIELYRRECPDRSVAERDWLAKTDIITVTSSEALRNLVALTASNDLPDLFDKPLVVVSERAASLARELGFQRPAIVSPQACDDALLQTVTEWATANRRNSDNERTEGNT